jgi:hypothetical protein
MFFVQHPKAKYHMQSVKGPQKQIKKTRVFNPKYKQAQTKLIS